MPDIASNFLAGGTINPSRFVKLDTASDKCVLQAGANERIIGISQVGTHDAPGVGGAGSDAAASGEPIMVFLLGEVAPLQLGSGGCSAGDLLKSDADGKGVSAMAVTGQQRQWIGAIAEESGSENDIITARVVLLSHFPTIS